MVYFLCAVIGYLSTLTLINPWVYMLAFVPVLFTGGNCALITGIFGHITDVTTEKDRALRMSLIEAALFVGILIGSLASSYIYNWTSAPTLFAISSAMALASVLYIIFFVNESINESRLGTIVIICFIILYSIRTILFYLRRIN